ncbi:carotenoid ester lipase precursor [Mycena belliarum]|uniref:Carboxylic ester hydrolase n=1 Tax=Mycena belliarum TaxID=1033014 RepID=A0AAD6TTP1_9AGAR|nr:carotenoid ester lipase precursor [Mycena belliae]
MLLSDILQISLSIFWNPHVDIPLAKAPVVSLGSPYGSFRGFNAGNLTKFLGMPFAHAERFEVPKAPRLLSGVLNATDFGPACPQQATTPNPAVVLQTYPVISEDCLTLDVFKPAMASSKSKLPVFVWFYGGGWQIGNSRDTDVSPLVERSIEVHEPIIIVVPNYRLNAFGFLGGREVNKAGVSNLGLRDQISALAWVKRHISAFGGDSGRVVIGGQSAGAVSASMLLLHNKQDSSALFRGAFMQSGVQFKSPSTFAEEQSTFNNLVVANHCDTSRDTLGCLRHVPFNSLMATIDKTPDFLSYRSVALVWHPHVDGDVLMEDAMVSVSKRHYAKMPIMTGSCDDEGTLFALAQRNITNNVEFLQYIQSNYLPAVSLSVMEEVRALYPDNPSQGSPFNTGFSNQLTPEFKRLAAFQGDMLLTGPRRFFLEHASATQNAWSWLDMRGKKVAALGNVSLGAFHGIDFPLWFLLNNTTETIAADALLNFINTLNPNHPAKSSTTKPAIFWPMWRKPSSAGKSSLLTFSDFGVVNITADDFRVGAIGFMNDLLMGEAVREVQY